MMNDRKPQLLDPRMCAVKVGCVLSGVCVFLRFVHGERGETENKKEKERERERASGREGGRERKRERKKKTALKLALVRQIA